MKNEKLFGIIVALTVILGSSGMAMGAGPLFKDYNAAVVQEFDVPPNVPAPDVAGHQIAEKVVYQLRRYSQKYKLFDMVFKEGEKTMPAGTKVLLIKGEVREYTMPTVRRRIIKGLVPGGEYTATAAFAAHYQFIDKASGKVIYETDLRTTAHFDEDTVDYAMERNAEGAAKVVYSHKK